MSPPAAANLSCPHCRTRLRLAETLWHGQLTPCPDCHGLLRVLREGAGLTVAPCHIEAEATNTPSIGPKRVSLLMAAGVAVFLVAAYLLFGSTPSPAPAPAVPVALAPLPVPAALAPNTASPVTSTSPAAAHASPVEQSLKFLSDHLRSELELRDAFPAAARPSTLEAPWSTRWSWLIGAKPPSAQFEPLWERPWDDPINDRFVRRAYPEVINPALSTPLADDGRPASHYVGLAGLDADGPVVPAGHPHAGVFSSVRQTRRDEVVDGLSNTIAVAGVVDRLGSWSAAAHGIRPFTRGPLPQGPDGFGDGRADAMQVLMADGSVRTVSALTHEAIIRKQVALADELLRPQDLPFAPQPAVALGNDVPVVPAEVPPPFAIEHTLGRKLARFRQNKPATVDELLDVVEEMIAFPILRDDPRISPQLAKKIELDLAEPTVEEVLQAILAKVDLGYVATAREVRLTPKP